MNLVFRGNTVDLCDSCEKNYEACDAYDGDYFYGDAGKTVCCCEKYVPLMTRKQMEEKEDE